LYAHVALLLNWLSIVIQLLAAPVHARPLGDSVGDVHHALLVKDMAPSVQLALINAQSGDRGTYVGLKKSLCDRRSSNEPLNSIDEGNKRTVFLPSSMMKLPQ
jgi:hypothetical protein